MKLDTDELQRLFARQQARKWALRQETAERRKQKLQLLREKVAEHRPEIINALQSDLRKPDHEAEAEIQAVLMDIDDAMANIETWMRPQVLTPSEHLTGADVRIVYEPRGICLIFGPWNFPFQLLFQPLVPVIAAGNVAICKPNEMAPATSAVSAKILHQAFSDDEVAVVEGGIEIANSLLALPVDHVFFTGSPAVGSVVMRSAAQHLASVTLELGGKCPAIVDASADIELTAATLVAARFYNAGQVCLCPDIIWVDERVEHALLERIETAIREQFYQNGKLDTMRLGRIINQRNLDRVASYLREAEERGAHVHLGGMIDATDLTIEPTVLRHVPLDARIMREEIFGPLMVLQCYRTLDEVTAFSQHGGKPLALYVFSHDEAITHRLITEIPSGGVTVNGWALHWFEPKLPFGGINQSGMGCYHGEHGFRELSHERAVLTAPKQITSP